MAEIQPSEDFLTFSEVSHEPDYYDDWLFNSTRRYKHVSMYETEKSISSAQWFGENKQYICVGRNEMSNNDILVYKLPCAPKEDEIDVLSKDRELSILAASSCVNETYRLALSPESFSNKSLIARTEYGSSKISLYNVPSDLTEATIASIDQVDTLDLHHSHSTPPTVSLHGTALILSAVTTHDITSTDIITQKSEEFQGVKDSSVEPVSALLTPTDQSICFICGSRSGTVSMIDRRDNSTNSTQIYKPAEQYDMGGRWTMCAVDDTHILLVSENNELHMIDLRSPGKACSRNQLAGPPWTGRKRISRFQAQTHSRMLSISGRDNKVRIYDTGDKSGSSRLEPVFIHDGHLPDVGGGDMPVVTCHSWNTFGEPRLLSSTDNGQLHTWMYNTELNQRSDTSIPDR